MFMRSKKLSEDDPDLKEPEIDSVVTDTINSEGSDSTKDSTINMSVLINLVQLFPEFETVY